MGTGCTVKIVTDRRVRALLCKFSISRKLKQLEQQFSIFNKDSEVNRFALHPPDQPFALTADMCRIFQTAVSVAALSGGAFDPGIRPLVELWGFGSDGTKSAEDIPDNTTISTTLAATGLGHISLDLDAVPPTITAAGRQAWLDFGGIAKGYGVDAVCTLLNHYGFTDYLVEIGGECRASGQNRNGHCWNVGITRPDTNASRERIYQMLCLHNMAVATSGDYRNTQTNSGKTYAHIIAPQTGAPITGQVAGATVIAPECAFADALATALMVMDVKKSLKLVDRLDEVECLLISRAKNSLQGFASQGFYHHLANV